MNGKGGVSTMISGGTSLAASFSCFRLREAMNIAERITRGIPTISGGLRFCRLPVTLGSEAGEDTCLFFRFFRVLESFGVEDNEAEVEECLLMYMTLRYSRW